MSHHRGPRRTWAEELSAADIEDSEPTTGLTTGDLTNSPSPSVDPQQSPRMLPLEHPDDPHATAYGSQTAPSREQLPSRGGMRPRTAPQGLSPSQLAGVSGTAHRGSHTPPRVTSITATQGRYSPRGITHRSESCSDSGQVSPTGGDTTEDFFIKGSEVIVLHQEYSEFITLKDNAEIVLAEAMEATERLNTAPLSRNIPEDIPHAAHGEQGEDSQLRHGREVHTVYARDTPEARVRDTSQSTRRRCDMSPTNTQREPVSVTTHDRPSLSANRVIQGIPESIEHSRHSITEPQSIDMNALREEIKATISATIKEKLRSDADSVTTVSQSMQALDSNAQYWSDLSTKATRSPEEALLEAAREVCSIHFQLDQSSGLREAGLMPEQQVQFSANTGRNIVSPSRNYGPNPIIESHIPQSEVNAQFG
ncbi:hypothetical protein M422DRAFT_239496 [Sphaerobolus stellatus SS14]|nr:hypothetical protein M422DRAFT_239496 [Sphaerobolus stellatus SS14]